MFEREFFSGINVLYILWFVRAFDNFGCTIIFTDPLDEFLIRGPITFRDKNIVRSFKILWRFSERSSGQEFFIAERRVFIN